MHSWRPNLWWHEQVIQDSCPNQSDRLRTAMQKALIGQITPTMRLVSVEEDPKNVRVIVYFDEHLDEDDRAEFAVEISDCLGHDLGDPPAGPTVESYFIRCDEPQLVPVRGEVVFSRKGVRAF